MACCHLPEEDHEGHHSLDGFLDWMTRKTNLLSKKRLLSKNSQGNQEKERTYL
jgi:hypothetical protein